MGSEDRKPAARGRNNLVALGTAAVLAVYAAGFDRTRAAAQKFAEADAMQRRPAPPSARLGDTMISAPASRPVDSVPVVQKPTAKKVLKDSASKATVPAGVAHAADTAATHPNEKAAAPATPPAVDSVAKADSSAQTDRGPYKKDGTFYGWGKSRHGDIQAGVEISNGRITAAWIEQCLTQYSCSWISGLTSQVEKRQSAEVDFVSGATQSTNAFYYGVVQALSQSK